MDGHEIMVPYLDFNFHISLITEIEIRSKNSLTIEQERQIKEILKDYIISEIGNDVKKISIAINLSSINKMFKNSSNNELIIRNINW